MFTVNQKTGILTPCSPKTVATESIPNALFFDPEGNFAYTANFLSNSISMYKINKKTGVLEPLSPSSIATGARPSAISITR